MEKTNLSIFSKLIFVSLTMGLLLFFASFISFATATPTYDPTYNNNSAAFFANGTPITISAIPGQISMSRISWNNGQNHQDVPITASVFGGGHNTSDYTTSHITMNSGNVAYIYGGGYSLTEAFSANLEESNIIINDGTITSTIYAGGLLFSKVENANCTINGGTIASVVGGGCASKTIDGISYSSGTEIDAKNSGTQTNDVNLTINDGTITTSAWGGGQGYSSTGNVNFTINNGNLSSAYLTAGGSNGFTESVEMNINGGDIEIYQSVNRGVVEVANIHVAGGNIDTFYIGGEQGTIDVNGTLNNSNLSIINGNINNLYAGVSGSATSIIDLTLPAYNNIAIVQNTVTNSNIPESVITEISYTVSIVEDSVDLLVGDTYKLTADITSMPTGYEYLFDISKATWSSTDTTVATVDTEGIVTAIGEESSIITLTLYESSDNVTINITSALPLYLSILLMLLLVPFFSLLLFYTFLRISL